MDITRLDSIQDISVMYETGDLPVLVLCSDKQQYICKYMRPNATIAYKLACELIGATFAEAWKINTTLRRLLLSTSNLPIGHL